MHNKLCNVKNMQASISCNIFVPLDTVLSQSLVKLECPNRHQVVGSCSDHLSRDSCAQGVTGAQIFQRNLQRNPRRGNYPNINRESGGRPNKANSRVDKREGKGLSAAPSSKSPD